MREEPETVASLSAAEDEKPKRLYRLWLLLIAHLALGLFFSIWTDSKPTHSYSIALFLLVMPVFGFVLSQAFLLVLWLVFSPASWWKRLASLMVGAVYLKSLLIVGWPDAVLLTAMLASGIAVILGVIRWQYANLRHFPQPPVKAGNEGLKLSIRGLMFFTFVIAVTIVGAKLLRESTSEAPNLFLAFALSLSFVVVGVASVWAVLGLPRPIMRSAVVLLISAVLGSLLVYALNLHLWTLYSYFMATGNPMVISYFTSSDHWAIYLSFTALMLLYTGVLIASLLVVRGCGYRLVRMSDA